MAPLMVFGATVTFSVPRSGTSKSQRDMARRDRDGVFRTAAEAGEEGAIVTSSAVRREWGCRHRDPAAFRRGICPGCGRTENEIEIERDERKRSRR